MIFLLSEAMYHFLILLKKSSDPVPENSIFAICTLDNLHCKLYIQDRFYH